MADTELPPPVNAPLSYAELQKLDDGTYIAEVRKNQANVNNRTRDLADKAWKIAAGVAVVIVATGFTDRLQSTPGWVRAVGGIAVLAWLVATGAFIWVNIPLKDGAKSFSRHWALEEQAMQREIEEAESAKKRGDPVPEREVAAKLPNRVMRGVLNERFRGAAACAFAALIITAIALVAVLFTSSSEERRTGRLLLTADGQQAVLEACPDLTKQTIGDAPASLDTAKIGKDEPVAITFEAGICNSTVAVVYLDGELLRGLAD
jgi:hypothetical protein